MSVILGPWPETPTTGECCEASAYSGPEACTCWQPVYDVEQAAPDTNLAETLQPRMCGDCAYRPGSPERRGDPDALGNTGYLNALVEGGQIFWCHQGMRRPTRWEHPSGMSIPGSPNDYHPGIADGRPFKADGTPADVCTGWAARRLKFMWKAGR